MTDKLDQSIQNPTTDLETINYNTLTKPQQAQVLGLLSRVTPTKAIYLSPQGEIQLSNKPISPFLKNHKLITTDSQQSSPAFQKIYLKTIVQQAKVKLIEDRYGELPGSEFFKYLYQKGLLFSQVDPEDIIGKYQDFKHDSNT